MTDIETNRAIATVCGTLRGFYCQQCKEERDDTKKRHVHRINGKEEWFCNFCDDGPLQANMPDYVHDLNAMHEAESVIGTDHEWSRSYVDWLQFIGGMGGIHSASPLRAEGFLRTMVKRKTCST